jgi:phosphorylcholine metabolism protein LicD
MSEIDTKLYFRLNTPNHNHYLAQQLNNYMKWFERKFKVHVYLIYGTLLGAYREHKFIPHDYDIDISYLSKYTEIKKIIEEKDKILNELKRQKLLVKRFNDGHNHVKSLDRIRLYDLWTSWLDKDGKFYCTGFYNGCLDKKDVLPFSTCVLENRTFKVPKDTDKFLTVYYGDWKIPQKEWQQTTPWVGLKNE